MRVMQTVTLEEPGRFTLTDTDPPASPGPGEVLVRVRRVGVCGTDLHAFAGRQPFFDYPRILGHELGVEVVDVGEGVDTVTPGDVCAVEPYLNCGDCVACRAGRTNCCTSLNVLGVHTDGGMRESIVVPAHKLHVSRAGLTLEQLALIETLGIGAHAVDRSAVQPGEPTLVIGAGPIGLSVVQFAQLAGADVAVMDMNPARLAFCREQFNVERCITAGDDPAGAVRDAFGDDGPTLVFDATGNAASMQAAFELPVAAGRVVCVGLVLGELSFNDPSLHKRELTILASRNSTSNDFRRIIDLMEQGRIDTSPWITHRAALRDVPDTFASWRNPESRVVKAMVDVE